MKLFKSIRHNAHNLAENAKKNVDVKKIEFAIKGVKKENTLLYAQIGKLVYTCKKSGKPIVSKEIDKTLKVLFEKRLGDYLIGHASDYLQVKVKTNENLIGEIVNIKIEKYSDMLEGSIAS